MIQSIQALYAADILVSVIILLILSIIILAIATTVIWYRYKELRDIINEYIPQRTSHLD